MTSRFFLGFASALLVLGACERKAASNTAETSGPASPSAPAESLIRSPVASPSTWDTSAGPLMFVRASSSAEAYAVFPEITDSTAADAVHFDSLLPRNATVELFERGGSVGTARIGGLAGGEWRADQCIEWPGVKLRPTPAVAPGAGWTVAFLEGRARALALDTIQTMPHADSARLAADIARLVSTAPDTAHTFRGIPFLVRTAYRFAPVPGVEAVVADVVRTLNQEAAPLEEHTLVIGERPSGSAGPYKLAYREVSAGPEETIETSDVLAAVTLGGGARSDLVLVREGYESRAYALLERRADGRWHLRWSSAHTGC
jgi:hypothetical protein